MAIIYKGNCNMEESFGSSLRQDHRTGLYTATRIQEGKADQVISHIPSYGAAHPDYGSMKAGDSTVTYKEGGLARIETQYSGTIGASIGASGSTPRVKRELVEIQGLVSFGISTQFVATGGSFPFLFGTGTFEYNGTDCTYKTTRITYNYFTLTRPDQANTQTNSLLTGTPTIKTNKHNFSWSQDNGYFEYGFSPVFYWELVSYLQEEQDSTWNITEVYEYRIPGFIQTEFRNQDD